MHLESTRLSWTAQGVFGDSASPTSSYVDCPFPAMHVPLLEGMVVFTLGHVQLLKRAIELKGL